MLLNKRKRNILIVSAGIILLLIILPTIVIRLYENTIRSIVGEQIEEHINAQVSYEAMNFSIFHNFPNITLTLKKVTIVGLALFKEDTLASAEEIGLELNLYKLMIHDQTELNSITLYEPLVKLRVLENGKANYDIIKSDTLQNADDAHQETYISLKKFVIKKGMVTYRDWSKNIFIEMIDLDHTGKGDFTSEIFDYSTNTEIKQFTFQEGHMSYFHKKRIAIDLVLEMNRKEKRFTFKKNTFGINQFVFGMDGKMTLLPKGYDLDISIATKETSFQNILALIPGLYMEDLKQITTEGKMECKGQVKGVYIPGSSIFPAFHAEVKVKNASFKVDTLPVPVTDIQFELIMDNHYGNMDSTIFDLQTFHMNIDGNFIHGRYKMQGFKKVYIDADIKADVDLKKIKDIYPLKGVAMEGKLKVDLNVKGFYHSSITQDGLQLQQVPMFHASISLKDGILKYDSLHTTFNAINVLLTGDNQTGNPEHTTIDLKKFVMNMGKAPVSATMLLKGIKSCYIKSDIKASIDLADMDNLYPMKGKIMKGDFLTDLTIDGIYDKDKGLFPTMNAAISLTNGYLKTPDYPSALENIHVIANAVNTNGKPEDTRINIEQFSYMLEGDPFSMNGYIEDLVKMNYDLKIKGIIHLGKMTKIYPIKGITLRGKINTDIEAKGSILDLEEGRYANTYCNGTIELKHVQYTSEARASKITISDAYFRLTPTKVIMERCKGMMGKSDVSLTGELTNYMYFITSNTDMIKGDLILACDTLDLTEWVDATNTSGNSLQASEAAGTAIWEVPKNVDFVFDSDLKTVLYQDIRITQMKGEITIKNGILSVYETGFNSLDASFGVNAHYDTHDMKHPKFDCKLIIKELDINKAYREIKLVRRLVPAAANTYGKASIDYQIGGELNNDFTIRTETLVGNGTLSIANAKINGMKMFEEISRSAKKQEVKDPHLKDFTVTTKIQDNKLYIDPFILKVNGLNTEIEGYNTINSGTINYTIGIEFTPIEKIKIPFHVTGTYDDPKVTMGKGKKTQ